MENDKGITLVVLIITVVVMLILAGVSINITSNMQEEMRIQALKTQLDILQTEVIDKYENIAVVTEDMKKQEDFVRYTPEELEEKGFTKPEQDAYINWSTRQVKMFYKGTEYFSEKYNFARLQDEEKFPSFELKIEFDDNRYKVEVVPDEKQKNLEVSYRVKAMDGENVNDWIIVDGYKFEYVNYGIYEVRLKNQYGKETIKTINQTLETLNLNESIGILQGTLGEKLIDYTINSESEKNNVIIIGKNILNADITSGYYNKIDGSKAAESYNIYKSTQVIMLPAGTYTISSKNDIGIVRILKKDNKLIFNDFGGYQKLPYTFTLTEKCEVGFSFRDSKSAQEEWTYGNTTKQAKIQVEMGQDVTDYEPYMEKKYEIGSISYKPDIYTNKKQTYVYATDENEDLISGEFTYIKTEILN